jgi:hypothetical protein
VENCGHPEILEGGINHRVIIVDTQKFYGDKYGIDWKHVDFRNMPLNFVENTYQKILEITRPSEGTNDQLD